MCFSHIGKEIQWRMSILAHLYLRNPLICPLPITKVSAAMLGGRGKIGLKLLFDLFMNAKGDYWWKLLSTGISYFWFDHLEALQGRKKPIARNDTPQGDSILQRFFFSPFRMLHNKLLLCVLLQSTCTWSTHQGTYPPLTLATSDQQQREEGWFYCIFLPCICMYLCTCVCVHICTVWMSV